MNYFLEDLNHDDDGRKWQIMLSSIISKVNAMEFTLGICDTETEKEMCIGSARETIEKIGLSECFIKVFATNSYYQRQFPWQYVIARLSIDSKLIKILESKKTLLDYAFKGDEGFQDPAFYKDNRPLLWTVSSMSFANIFISDNQRRKLKSLGLSLDVDNGKAMPTVSCT